MKFLKLFLFWVFSSVHDTKSGEPDYRTAAVKTVFVCSVFQFLFFEFLIIVFNVGSLAHFVRMPIMLRYFNLLIPFLAIFAINYYWFFNKGHVVLDVYLEYKERSFWLTKSKWFLPAIAMIYMLILLYSSRWIHVNYH